MATAGTLSPGLNLTATWRSFQVVVLLALAAIGAGGVIYFIETYVLGSRHRFVENPSDVMMRAFGLAHFWIGWVFLFTSPRLRSGPALGKVAALTAIGAALCLFSWANGGMRNPLLVMAFYAYFLIHEIRDEANLFVAYGDAPKDPGREMFLRRLSVSVMLALMTAFAFIQMLHGRMQVRLERIVADPAPWLEVIAGSLVILGAGGWFTTWQCARCHNIVWRDYIPLLAVYASIAGILTVGSLLGSVGFNLIVLIHVMAWLVFVRQRLGAGNTAPRNLWAWLRMTPAGFITLHVGAVAVVLTLMALRVHLWERCGIVSQLFATSSFHYWTIMHITMALWRK
jgi:hypothetical protein